MKYQTLSDFIDEGVHYHLYRYGKVVPIDNLQLSTRDIWDIDTYRGIFDKVLWIQNPAHLFKLAGNFDLVNYLRQAPPGFLISYMSLGDQWPYETLRPFLEEQKQLYHQTGKLKNFFFMDFSHKVDPAFAEEFKDVVHFRYDPMFSFMYRIAQDDMGIRNYTIPESNIKKHFLSLNARGSWDRQALFYFMIQHNLLDKSYFSYLCEDPDRKGFGKEFDRLHKMSEGTWYCDKLDIEKVKQMIPYVLDTSQWTYGAIESKYYSESFCSIVLETHQKTNDPMITEKILKSIRCGHPFLLFSGSHTLAELRKFGFETYSTVFDENYDLIEDPQLRLEAIFNEILRISNWSIDECNQVAKKIKPMVDYNINHYLKYSETTGKELVRTYAHSIIPVYEEKLSLLV